MPRSLPATLALLLLGVLVGVSQEAAAGIQPFGPAPVSCLSLAPPGAISCDARGDDVLGETWVADFALDRHLVHPGEVVTGTVSGTALPEVASWSWPSGLAQVSPCAPTQPTCRFRAGGPTDGWRKVLASFANPIGYAYEEDFLGVLPSDRWAIEGHVVDRSDPATPRPVAGVAVRLLGTGGGAVTTNADGYYAAAVPRGSYTVVPALDGACVLGESGCRPSAVTRVPASRVVDVVVGSTFTLTGTVHDLEGDGLPGVVVEVAGSGRTFTTTTTGPGGGYAIVLPPGAYRIRPVADDVCADAVAAGRDRAAAGLPCAPYADVDLRADAARSFSASMRAALELEVRGRDTGSHVVATLTVTATTAARGAVVTADVPTGLVVDTSRRLTASRGGVVARLPVLRTTRVRWQLGDMDRGARRRLTIEVPVERGLTVPDGRTLAGVGGWTANGWKGTTAQLAPGGGCLAFSDRPEFLAPSTRAAGRAAGDAVEGVLYREGDQAVQACVDRPIRVYLNHENRTDRPKTLLVVVRNPGSGPVELFQGPSGTGHVPGDPVATGKAALQELLPALANADPAPAAGSGTGWTRLGSLGPGEARALSVATLAPAGRVDDVVNAIRDIAATGRIEVGVVVVDAASVNAFMAAPLAYAFQGDTARTYLADAPLENPRETHVRGTFPHDELTVELPSYDAGGARRLGWRLGDDRGSAEYEGSLEDPSVRNVGNYGVLYRIVPRIAAAYDDADVQVILNPRGVGDVLGPGGQRLYTNAFTGLVRIGDGPLLQVPADRRSVTDPALGIGAGRIRGSAAAQAAYRLELMPAAGTTLPVAVVLSPAHVVVQALLRWRATPGRSAVTEGIPVTG